MGFKLRSIDTSGTQTDIPIIAEKVENKLTAGSKTFDGSSPVTITLEDLGGAAAGAEKTADININPTKNCYLIGTVATENGNVTFYRAPTTCYFSSTGEFWATKTYNAVFNDYAEYRLCVANIDAGLIVTEDDKACDYVVLCKTKKPRSKMFVVSDTYGSCMGESINSIPVALVGRVLVYIEDGVKVKVGDYIGCGKNGKGRRMSRIEAFLYPNRVLGTVSSIPKYEEWGSNNVKINGRVWVNLK